MNVKQTNLAYKLCMRVSRKFKKLQRGSFFFNREKRPHWGHLIGIEVNQCFGAIRLVKLL